MNRADFLKALAAVGVLPGAIGRAAERRAVSLPMEEVLEPTELPVSPSPDPAARLVIGGHAVAAYRMTLTQNYRDDMEVFADGLSTIVRPGLPDVAFDVEAPSDQLAFLDMGAVYDCSMRTDDILVSFRAVPMDMYRYALAHPVLPGTTQCKFHAVGEVTMEYLAPA